MEKARELVRCYVAAGFTKIHIDTSMKVADDDPNERLSDATISRRGAELARVCEDTYQELLKQTLMQFVLFTLLEVKFQFRRSTGRKMQVCR